ncbi:unnamed protein product [Rhizoctonia solani]|uniref:CHAT domain-containing protein n=1 Tax=Rhizoctonia solani TaxID=456999 RepID=A0A8H3E553_9AGAM|nr:unnamed protein product [Rhizoctonia solani]
MEQHDWVHLACHAHQNVADPTQSGFFLYEGTLDLATINRRSFRGKGLAFLSACQTATGDEKLADEAVHLASGMLMAGYTSVIGTMWSVHDADAPVIADRLSYYISFIGSLRALNLIDIHPYLIKLYKPKAPVPSPTTSPSGSVTAPNTLTTLTRTISLPAVPKLSPYPPGTKNPLEISATNAQLIHRSILLSREQQFDLLVARLSMVMDFWSDFLLCSSTSATGFVLTTTLSAFGGGTSPAMQSLALGLGGEEKDVGKLFGALSMLSSISSTILSVFLALVQPRQPLRRRDLEEFSARGRIRGNCTIETPTCSYNSTI